MKVNHFLIWMALWTLLGSWGEKGHQKINGQAPVMFPSRLNRFKGWIETLTEHGSDADKRKKSDPSEEIKHYIDIDAYSDFQNSHTICEEKEAAISKYGKDFIMKNGTLPWVTDSTYQALVKQFKSGEWERAVLTAADLGHYVGDGHMPLHLTVNYDGQVSGQTGIHRRYENQMISRYVDSIPFNRARLRHVSSVNNYIFSYIYKNYSYKDSLLIADQVAFTKANNEYNDEYYKTLWALTRGFTEKLMAKSSKSVAELVSMAWKEAGRPRPPAVIHSENSGEKMN